jgi:CHAT domain-containing protein/tetratricopeptide (TPR) repeat protein
MVEFCVRSVFAQIALVALAFAVAAAAQSGTTADQLLAHAKSVYSSTGPSAALAEYEKVLAAYRADQNRHGEAITLGLIGNCYKHLGDRSRALDFLGRALKMKQELGDRLEEGKTLSNIGLVYWEAGDYPKAIDHFDRAIAIAREVHDPQLEGAALNNLSLVYDEQGDYKRSLQQYQQALALHRAAHYPEGESDALGNIGGVYLLLGHFSEASDYYQQALAIDERLDRKPAESQDLGNLAICQAAVGQLDESVRTFDRALSLASSAGLKKEEADWEKGRASTLLRLGKFDAALQEYRAALASYERAGLKRELVEALHDDGYVHLMLGDRRSAEQSFQRASQVSKQISFPRGVLINTLALADVAWRSGNLATAVASANDAVKRARKLEDWANTVSGLLVLSSALRDEGKTKQALAQAREAVSFAQQSGAKLLEAQALDTEGEVLLRLGSAEDALRSISAAGELLAHTGDTALPWHIDYLRGQALESVKRDEEAVAAYRRSITSIESIRGSISEDRFRTGFLQDKQKVYVAMVQLLLRMGRAGEALQYSERLRARGYFDLLTRSALPPSDPHIAELQTRIRRLERAIDEENSKALSEQRGSALSTFSGELADAEREYSDLVGLHASGAGAGVPSPAAPPDPAETERELPADRALIEYVVGPRQVAIFVLRHDGLHATLEPVRSLDLESKVTLLRDLIRRPDSTDWQLPAQSLRHLLVDPIEKAGWLHGVNEIVIVPHGFLYYLPFAALARPTPAGDRFLVEDYVVSYLPTAALAMSSRPQPSGGRLVALAPSVSNLRFTSGEARAVAAAFGRHGTAIVGPNATETWFKHVAGDYDVIHFATHGFFNKANPLFSGVELEPDAQNDGRLEVYEILGLHLRSPLVTLSACETALGGGYFTEIPAGDEFVGLTRAFLSAGASTVVATLWEVNDSSTAQLMRSFYHQVSEQSPSLSLAIAQRLMLHGNAGHRHPYYWSAFVVVGNGHSLIPAGLAENR